MKGIYKRSYWLWGLYQGMFIALEYDLFDFLNNDEINSALYSYWVEQGGLL